MTVSTDPVIVAGDPGEDGFPAPESGTVTVAGPDGLPTLDPGTLTVSGCGNGLAAADPGTVTVRG